MSEKRKRSSNVSEIEERERVKESILKVFRAEYNSPSKGGAVVIGQPRQNEQQRHTPPKDIMSGRSRSKRKSSRQRKSSTKKSPAAVKSDSAVSKHMKIARGIVYSHGKDKGESNLVNRIAPSRLTHKVGIFNVGKRSKTATRGLFVPEHIQLQTEADIKKIIQEVHMDSPPCDSHNIPDSESYSRPVDISSSSSKMADTAAWVSDTKTPNSKVNLSVASGKTVNRSFTSSSDRTMENSLEPLVIKDTLKEILLPLGALSKKIFPNRDCLKETVSILQKLLKQNAPRSATPTPIPALNKIRTSGGIQRSLFMDSFNPQPSTSIKSPGLTSDRLHPHTTDDIFSAQPFGQYATSAQVVSYPGTLYDKTNILSTESTSYRPTQSYSDHDHRKSDHDMHYYRSRVLGTEGRERDLFSSRPTCYREHKQPSTCIHSNTVNDLDLFPSTINKESRHLSASIQHGRTHSHSISKERSNVAPGISIDMEFGSKDDICMKPTDDFSAFFNDFKIGQNRYADAEEKQRINKRPITPVDERLMKITQPISPLRDHEPVTMLHAIDRRSNQRQKYEPMDCEMRKEDAMGLLEKNDRMETLNKERLSQEDCQCSCGELRCNSHISNGSMTFTNQNKMMYMPGFHSDFYTDHISTKDILWQKPGLYSKGESMDILDQVDLDTAMDVQHNLKHGYRSEGRDILHVASMNTETSSAWKHMASYRELQSAYQKPTITNEDSPGIIMLPRKMY